MSPSFGQVMRKARQDQGITLRALASAAGLSHPFLCEIERGTRRVPGDKNTRAFQAMARLLGQGDWKWWRDLANRDRRRPIVTGLPTHVAEFMVEISDAAFELKPAQIMLARDAISHGETKIS